MTQTTTGFLLSLLFIGTTAHAQIPRERANPGGPVDELFWAPSIIMTSSVTNLPRGSLNFSIKHSFGLVSSGAEELWGLDGAANIRFGLDFSVHDRLSLGFGRSRFDKLYDFRFKGNVLRQSKDDRIPLEVAVMGDIGINTTRNGFEFIDRLSYLTSVMVARKFTDRMSLQIAPMLSHFNTVFLERASDGEIIAQENDHLALALAGRYVLTDRLAVVAEYIPVLGNRSDRTYDALSLGLDIETGGHVFQLFLTTSHWTTEQHVIARNTDRFQDGDFRFGFNVNRVF